MVDSNAKGDRRERELVNALYDDHGFVPMRAPASGSATEHELPDVFAGKSGVFYAIEAKASGGDPIYVEKEEIDALEVFAEHWGAHPRIGARFDREPWAFFNPYELHRTPGGNFRVKVEDIHTPDATRIEEL